MNQKASWGIVVVVAIVAIVSGVIVWLFAKTQVPAQQVVATTQTVTQVKQRPAATTSQTQSASQTSQVIIPANWKTYSDSKYGYSFKYPDNLVVSKSLTQDSMVLMRGEFWNVEIDIADNKNGLSLENLTASEVDKEVFNLNNSLKTIDKGVVIGGKEGKEFMLNNSEMEGLDPHVEAVLLLADNKIMVITANSEGKQYFDSFLSTFKFTN